MRIRLPISISIICALYLFIICSTASAQESRTGKAVICYYNHQQSKQQVKSETYRSFDIFPSSFSTNEISYNDVPLAAIPAIQQAIDTWSTVLVSAVPIRINVIWMSLPGNQIATTRSTRLFKNFKGAIQPDIWYPVALAEKITGMEMNAGAPDIEIILNQDVNWYFGTQGNTPQDQLDLQTVVLHEMAHGLGINSFAHTDDDRGVLREDGLLSIYDLLLENSKRERLYAFNDNTSTMYAQLTSNNIFIFSPTAARANHGTFPKVYAPMYYSLGSSISHLDEQAYPPGDANSLMTPSFSPGEAIHTPGNVVLGILSDLGWGNSTRVEVAIVAYPNPSSGIFKLSVPLNISSSALSLFDISGKTIKKNGDMKFSGTDNQVDISEVSAGLYLLLIQTQRERTILKVMVTK